MDTEKNEGYVDVGRLRSQALLPDSKGGGYRPVSRNRSLVEAEASPPCTITRVNEIGYDEFVELAESSLAELPDGLAELLDNVTIVVDDWPEKASAYGSETLYGLYEGVPLTQRDSGYNAVLPDRITIFRGPLQRDFVTRADLEEQIKVTIIHEIAHHFGFGEERLRELGWG